MQPADTAVSVTLVEDDPFFRARLEEWLRASARFALLGSYPDAEKAIQGIHATQPSLAIVDFGLPSMKGDELICWLKAHAPAIKIIAITGIPYAAVVFDALDAGADGFLDKEGLKAADFLAQLDQVMAGGHPLSKRATNLVVEEYRKYRLNPTISSLLTLREKEIAELLCRGLDADAIAKQLGISPETVRTHKQRVYAKVNAHNRAELQIKAFGLDRRRS